jgi:hypothetical protein
MRTAILLPHWGRPKRLPHQLEALDKQSVKDFDVIVSNSNPEHDNYMARKIKLHNGGYKIYYRLDSNDVGAFRRFTISRDLSYDRYIWLDDDVNFGSNLVADMYKQYEPNTYHSWYCWQILGDYHDRIRVAHSSQPICYAGTGVSMIDRTIVDRPELYECPPEAVFIEDLWLTYVVDHVYKWQIKNLKIPNVKLGGSDSVALYRTIAKSNYTKRQFMEDLRARGWDK